MIPRLQPPALHSSQAPAWELNSGSSNFPSPHVGRNSFRPAQQRGTQQRSPNIQSGSESNGRTSLPMSDDLRSHLTPIPEYLDVEASVSTKEVEASAGLSPNPAMSTMRPNRWHQPYQYIKQHQLCCRKMPFESAPKKDMI